MPVYFPPSSSSSTSNFQNILNWNPTSNLTHWRAAKARISGKTGNARILCIGDSTTLGVGASGSLTTGEMPGEVVAESGIGRLQHRQV